MAATEERVVTADEAGTRLDKLLAALPSIGSREKARQALRSGKVSVDGRPAGPDDGGRTLSAGARVEIAWTRPGTGARRTAAREAMARAGVEIVHEDDHLLVANKPAGLLTDAADAEQAKYQDTLRKRVKAWLTGRPVWPAHRIDRDTTGLVCFAKTEAAREHLKAQWIERRPERVYLAIVEGAFPRSAGRFSDWMVWDGAQRLQREASADTPNAWLAEATYTVIESFGSKATALEVRLVSGRRNQIRLHAMLAGHPLVGEPLYRRRDATLRFPRQALHALRLGLEHPGTGEPMSFEAPLPPDLVQLLAALRDPHRGQ